MAGISPTFVFVAVEVQEVHLCVLSFFFVRARCEDENEWQKDVLVCCVFCIPAVVIVSFFVVYGLALDGSIATETTGDWAAVMAPWWILGLVGVLAPLVVFVVIWRGAVDPVGMEYILVWCGGCCWCGVVGVFNLCLIGLVMKASGKCTRNLIEDLDQLLMHVWCLLVL